MNDTEEQANKEYQGGAGQEAASPRPAAERQQGLKYERGPIYQWIQVWV